LDYPDAYVMIEFVVKDRRLRLYPDGKITIRAIMRGKETKKEIWNDVRFGDNGIGYLQCNITINGGQKGLLKHRLLYLARNPDWDIFDTSQSNCIDHKNHDTKDNSAENLRIVTQQQNQFNRAGVKGYYWYKRANKWQAYIKVDFKNKYLGLFEKEEDAHAAYLEAKARLHIIPES